MIRRPKILLVPAKIVHRLRLIPDRLYNFAVFALRDTASREFVYRVWLTFRDMNTPLDELCEVTRRHCPNVVLAFGKRDLAIPIRIAETVHESLQPHSHLIRIDRGHNLLCRHVDELLDAFLTSELPRRDIGSTVTDAQTNHDGKDVQDQLARRPARVNRAFLQRTEPNAAMTQVSDERD